MFLFATVFSLALGPGGPCTGLGFKLGPPSPHLWFDPPDPHRCGDSPPPWGQVTLRLGLLGQHWREEPAGSQRGLSVPVGGAGLGLHSTRIRWGGVGCGRTEEPGSHDLSGHRSSGSRDYGREAKSGPHSRACLQPFRMPHCSWKQCGWGWTPDQTLCAPVAALNRFTEQKLREQGGKRVPCGACETVQVTARHPRSRGGLPRKCPALAGQPLPGTLPAQCLVALSPLVARCLGGALACGGLSTAAH